MKKTHVSSLQFRPQGAQTIKFLGDISAVMGLKLKNLAQVFQLSTHVHPCHLSQQVTGNSLNASIKYCCTFSKTCKFWSSKANWHFHFSLPSIILAELLGHRTWQVQKVMVCDWLFSIHFVCFCGSRLTAFDCNYDWRQQKKKQLWKWLWWALWKVQ